MLTLSGQDLEPIAVIDDDRQAAESVAMQLEAMGATDLRILDAPSNPGIESMLSQVSDCALVLCDHKLNQSFKVNFYGVDLVAEVARRDQMGVLMTGQLPDEMHRIRLRLADVPAFWPREGGRKDLSRQIETAAAIKAGAPLAESRFFRAMIEIDALKTSGSRVVASVRIFGSTIGDQLDIPIELLDPDGRHGQGLAGEAIVAEVNLLEPNPRRIRIRCPEQDLLVGDRLLQDDGR